MKILLSRTTTIDLDSTTVRALKDEMSFACREVSVFPVMERSLALMEA